MAINFNRIDTDELEFNMFGRPDIDVEAGFKYPEISPVDSKEVMDTYKIVSENTAVIIEYGSIIDSIVSTINKEEMDNNSRAKTISSAITRIINTDETVFDNIIKFIIAYLKAHITSLTADSINNMNALTHMNDPEPLFSDGDESVIDREKECDDETEPASPIDIWMAILGDIFEELGMPRSHYLKSFIRVPDEGLLEYIIETEELESTRIGIKEYINEYIRGIKDGVIITANRSPMLIDIIVNSVTGAFECDKYEYQEENRDMYRNVSELLYSFAIDSLGLSDEYDVGLLPQIPTEVLNYYASHAKKKGTKDYEKFIDSLAKYIRNVINQKEIGDIKYMYQADEYSLDTLVDILTEDDENTCEEVSSLEEERLAKQEADEAIHQKYHPDRQKGFQSSEEYHESDFFNKET